MAATALKISCHCGQTAQSLEVFPHESDDIALCHCQGCRYSTGLLCASYQPVSSPPSLEGTELYSTGASTLHFCARCGCHVVRVVGGNQDEGCGHRLSAQRFEVATGIVVDEQCQNAIFSRHDHVTDTKDGGLSSWMSEIQGLPVPIYNDQENDHAAPSHPTQSQDSPAPRPDVLNAACACGRVKFHVTRPDESSREPRSAFPDLMIPYYSGSPELANPDDVKWWLRADGTKFLAGTCACQSCRLISGFEIQTWAFIPQSNIRGLGHEGALDFDVAHGAGVLRAYESSPGVFREFCPGCGATVFWRASWRPGLVDVSVGLLRSEQGALAGDWLDWWRGRVSFVEEAATGRHGNVGERAVCLIESLERGIKAEVGA